MNKMILYILLFASINTTAQNTITCSIATSIGEIQIELYPGKAPITVHNFLKYVDNKLYDNSNFYRVCTNENEAERDIKIEVVQAADLTEDLLFPTINIETTEQTKLRHINGTISMARGEPNTAQSSFFICINNQPELDFGGKRNPDGYGFAAFGKVIRGMDLVLKIQSGKNQNQILVNPITIYSIRRIN
ncbi:MAG: peptidylprolyl isomerase [Flavobacteriaceae bacterium]|nr:peptidylprolyl isomerase [Flavobacteriaceae bacterium]